MRMSITAVATLFASICLVFTGCERPVASEPQVLFDHEVEDLFNHEVFRENDLVPEARPARKLIVVDAPEPDRINRLQRARVVEVVEPVGPDRPIVTAANLDTADLDLRYNPATEMTIRDVVLGKRYVRLDADHTGVIVRLQPGATFIDVLVGTTKSLFAADVDLDITDKLMVTGSRIVVNGRPMILAKTLFLRDREIQLRDKDNYPLWRDPAKKPKADD